MDPESLRGKKIILFRTDRLGDLILSLPVVEALKARLPETRIDLATAPVTASLAGLQPNVSNVLPHLAPGSAEPLRIARILASRGYQAAIHLYPRPILALATFLARIPVRVGTAFRFYSPLFNRRVRIHRSEMVLHERDLNLRLIESLGIPCGEPLSGIRIPEGTREQIRRLLNRADARFSDGPWVVLHPGSGGSSLNWPAEHYAALGSRLVSAGIPVVLTGTEADRPVVEQVHRNLGDRALNLCARLDLPHLAALLSLAPLTVSNSTGPLHLADALGGRVIGLYSRHFYASPRRWGPYGQPENVFLPAGKPCPRCTTDRCREYNCLASIRPEAVLEKARDLLRQGKRDVLPPPPPGPEGER
jgi:ADP-heptose:LPS heptosyltransferase